MEEPQPTFNGGDSTHHLTNCLICYTSVVTLEGTGGEDNAALSLEKCVRAYFVLRHVLEFPPEKVTSLMGLSTALSDLGSWVSLCLSCADKVEELRGVYREMVLSARRFEGMRSRLLEEGKKEGEGNLKKCMEGGSGQVQLVWRWRKQMDKTGEQTKLLRTPEKEPNYGVLPFESPLACQTENNEPYRDDPDQDDALLVKEEPLDENSSLEGDVTGGSICANVDEASNKLKDSAARMETKVIKEELMSSNEGDDDWDGGSDGVDDDSGSGEEDNIGDEDDYPDKEVKKFQCDVNGCGDKGRMIDLETFLGHYHYHRAMVFKCTQCPRLFTKLLGVNNHWRVNHKEVLNSPNDTAKFLKVPPTFPGIPWWCTECPSDANKVFTSEDARNDHLQSDHPDCLQPEDFSRACNQCSRRYPSILELKLHQSTTHILNCDQCSELFTTQLALREHYEHAHQPKSLKYQCDHCSESFPRKHQLSFHRRSIHSVDIWKCPHCSKEFTEKKYFTPHVKRCQQPQEKLPCSCPHCGNSFSEKRTLALHISRVHLKQTVSCDHCNKSMAKSDLKRHLFRRHGIGTGKKHPCPVEGCSSVFFRKCHLDTHLNRKHKLSSPEFPCCHCGKLFYSQWSRKRHEDSLHAKELPFKCRFCDKRCSRMDNLRAHEKYHTDPEKQKKIKSRRKSYPCDKCEETFRQAILLKRHNRKMHETPKIPKRSRSQRRKKTPAVKSVGPAKCHLCGRMLKNRTILLGHIRRVHKKLERVCCELCGKELCGKGALKAHQALIHKIGWSSYLRRFECGVEGCGRKLRTKRLLELHMTQHSETPQFQCDMCGKAFYFRKHLIRHESALHSENKELKPYKCKICSKGFACSSYLWQHMKTHKSKETVNT